jgi:uncharacterized membrane protein YphA (DoxX/SURF4 family)
MDYQNFLTSSKPRIFGFLRFIFTAVRILIGWLFLYEGASKLFASGWTSAGYLMESHWIFSGMFHWMAETPTVLRIVDLINIWGLIFIGLFLFIGVFTRFASMAGAVLLLIYFIANPPFVGYIGAFTGEGHYLVVNKNLILIAILLLIYFIPKHLFFGLDRLFSRQFVRDQEAQPVPSQKGRREVLKDLASLPILGGFAVAMFRKKQWESFEERNLISQPSRVDSTTGATPTGLSNISFKELTGQVSKGRIGDLEVSRIICGGNLISGYAHSRDLIYVSNLVQAYFNDEKVIETMKLCEACGINTIVLRVDKNTLRLMEKYRKRNGKMQWIAQTKITDKDIKSDIDAAVDAGADGAYLHGGITDRMVAQGKLEIMSKAVEHINSLGVYSGVAAHDIRVIMACEEHGFDVDFYMKTLNSGNYWTAGPRLITDKDWTPDPYNVVEPEYGADIHDNIWATTPEQTIEVMKKVKKPWISYKVLGAGAIHPRDGFRYAFENGADFACVGMFDFQIVQNANIANEILAENLNRQRTWVT